MLRVSADCGCKKKDEYLGVSNQSESGPIVGPASLEELKGGRRYNVQCQCNSLSDRQLLSTIVWSTVIEHKGQFKRKDNISKTKILS